MTLVVVSQGEVRPGVFGTLYSRAMHPRPTADPYRPRLEWIDTMDQCSRRPTPSRRPDLRLSNPVTR